MKKHLTLLILLVFANGYTQLQNADFENWTETPQAFGLQPDGWQPYGYSFPVFNGPSTTPQNGNYAVTTQITYLYWKSALQQKAPIDYRPSALSGHYIYTHNTEMLDINHNPTIDTARVEVYLTKWNAQLAQSDTIGRGKLKLSGALSYKSFSCPINYVNDVIPDSITVRLDPSRAYGTGTIQNCRCAAANDCSFFTVDNLLPEQSLGLPEEKGNGIVLYPNPAVDFIEIKGYSGRVEIFDISGKKMQVQEVGLGDKISISRLQPGIYFVRIGFEQEYKFIRQ